MASALAGDGTGGNLAAAVCLAECNEATGHQPYRQILLYPCLDVSACMPSHKTLGDRYLIAAETHRWYRRNYVAGHGKPGLWRLSPLFAYDVSLLPPSVILYAGFDPLRDEAAAYAGRLRENGVSGRDPLFLRYDPRLHAVGRRAPGGRCRHPARGGSHRRAAGGSAQKTGVRFGLRHLRAQGTNPDIHSAERRADFTFATGAGASAIAQAAHGHDQPGIEPLIAARRAAFARTDAYPQRRGFGRSAEVRRPAKRIGERP
ncbi:MAG: alpha/beta hydrolase fold domain-containing protein [Rhizomicrobium sp.]